MYMTKSKAFELAYEELEKRKERAELENERRLEQIRTDYPDIQEVRNRISEMGMKIFFVLQNSKDPDKALNEIRKRNLEAQEMIKLLLRSHNLPEDYLEIPYTCKDCKDTGSNQTTGKRCDCLTILANQIWAKNLCTDSPIKLTSFDTIDERYFQFANNPEKMKKYFYILKDYAKYFKPRNSSIMIRGRTGLGKTHLALAIANEVIKKGYAVIYENAQNIVEIAENEKFSKNGDMANLINTLLDVDLLVIDDFGSEMSTEFSRSVLYKIIDSRLQQEQSTIITTNLAFKDINQTYDYRISSRILGKYQIYNLEGEDLRMILRKEHEKELKAQGIKGYNYNDSNNSN